MNKCVSIGFATLLATAAPAMAQGTTDIVRFDGSYSILSTTNCLKVRVGDTGTFRFTPNGASVGNQSPNNTSLAFFTPFVGHSYFKFGTFDVNVTYVLDGTTLPQAAVIPSAGGVNRYNATLRITNQSAINSQAVTLIMSGQITDFADSEPTSGGSTTCDVTFSAAAVRRFND